MTCKLPFHVVFFIKIIECGDDDESQNDTEMVARVVGLSALSVQCQNCVCGGVIWSATVSEGKYKAFCLLLWFWAGSLRFQCCLGL